jgi:hypothetical protein
LFIFARRFFNVLLIRINAVLVNFSNFSRNTDDAAPLLREGIKFIDLAVNTPIVSFAVIAEYGDESDMKLLYLIDGAADTVLRKTGSVTRLAIRKEDARSAANISNQTESLYE